MNYLCCGAIYRFTGRICSRGGGGRIFPFKRNACVRATPFKWGEESSSFCIGAAAGQEGFSILIKFWAQRGYTYISLVVLIPP